MTTLTFQHIFPQRKVPWHEFISIVIMEGIGFTIVGSFLQTYVCFPFPFVAIISSILSGIPLGNAFFFILARPLRESKKFWSMVIHFGALTFLILTMFVVYPYITFLFDKVKTKSVINCW